ncbi:hypothetical protein DESC_720042 [Desulfosarcina cetonica]|nr:hypothetical protein DESC_720042 [Desulfosarcina cetonica]
MDVECLIIVPPSVPALAQAVEGFHLHEIAHLHHALATGQGPQIALIKTPWRRAFGRRRENRLFFGLDISRDRRQGGSQFFFVRFHKFSPLCFG